MIIHLKSFLLAVTSFALLDYLWLGFVMKDFNTRQMSQLGRMKDGQWDVWLAPAIATYVLMALAMVVFVTPKDRSFSESLMYGALMGFCIYGVFDGTNAAILRDYPIAFIFPDVAWGTAVFAITAGILHKVTA